MSEKTDALFQKVTDQLIELIKEADAKGWTKPWTTVLAGAGIGMNALTKKQYQGWNILSLMMAQVVEDYEYNIWATYKQWKKLDAQVKGGETGTQLVRWGATYTCSIDNWKGPVPCSNGHANERRMWATVFTVFNVDQVDGYEVVEEDLGDEPTRLAAVETFIENTGAVIEHVKQNSAHYSPGKDTITLPVREQFDTPQGYYGTTLHELTHWAGGGGERRLERKVGKIFGDQQYAGEELVAELGSAFLSAQFGIEVEAHINAANYLKHWLAALESDPKALYRAAKLAQESTNYLTELATKNAEKSEEVA